MRMRFAGVVVTILTAGCTSTRGGGSADVEGPGVVVRESVPPSSVAPSGPMDARALGQELGLDVQDGGASVLLRSDNFLARVFPGSDRLTLNGRVVSMTESSRRDGSSVVVPASGVAAIRRGFAAAKVAPPVLAPAAPYRPAPVRFPGATAVPSLAKGWGTAGCAGWGPPAGPGTRPLREELTSLHDSAASSQVKCVAWPIWDCVRRSRYGTRIDFRQIAKA